jgi:hypothetical protein
LNAFQKTLHAIMRYNELWTLYVSLQHKLDDHIKKDDPSRESAEKRLLIVSQNLQEYKNLTKKYLISPNSPSFSVSLFSSENSNIRYSLVQSKLFHKL